MENGSKRCIAKDVEAVVTSFNQGDMILEAVDSLCKQTMLPARILLVDDGSTDQRSLEVIDRIKTDADFPVPVVVIQQPNSGVSAARNAGIRQVQTPMALLLDGDDKLEPAYLQRVRQLLKDNTAMVAASSWMHTFGVLDSIVCPSGGGIVPFLARNCCPATHILRREIWEKCGGYDESMRAGFEDWEFFLSMLEAMPNAQIGIVPQALIDYRTAPASSNIKSMTKRLELMGFIIRKHMGSYQAHLEDVILQGEAASMSRLYGWESQMCRTLQNKQGLSQLSDDFLKRPSYGDGGMAAAVRIASAQGAGAGSDRPDANGGS